MRIKAATMDFGSTLRQARESRGISLREIAGRTKISVRVLEALEKNDLSHLPGGIFTRAIIRSYAAEVGLDPDQAMRNFLTHFPHESGSYSIDAAESAFKDRRRIATTAVVLLAVAATLVAALVIWNARRRATTALDQPGATPDSTATASTGTEAASRPEGAAGTVSPSIDQPSSGAAAPANPDTLVLVVQPTSLCWVRLRVDGRIALARNLEAGQRETVTARDEILADAGDAAAFSFTINDLPGRVVGGRGEVVKLRITKENYRTFLR